jgi:hypothetical protein
MGSQSAGEVSLALEAGTFHGPVVGGGLDTLIQNPRRLAESNLANYSTLYFTGSPRSRVKH